MAPKETENNDYAKFGGDKKVLWYFMVFSGVDNGAIRDSRSFQSG